MFYFDGLPRSVILVLRTFQFNQQLIFYVLYMNIRFTLHELMSRVQILRMLYKFFRHVAWSRLSGVRDHAVRVYAILMCPLQILFHEQAIRFHGHFLPQAHPLRAKILLYASVALTYDIVTNQKVILVVHWSCIICLMCPGVASGAVFESLFTHIL